eukprot:183158_1
MDAFKAQQQIRSNASEISDYLSDLRSWGKEMEKKDTTSKQKKPMPQNLPPIRNQTKTAADLKKNEELALKYKSEGNTHFKSGKYKLAIQSYSKAIESTPYNAVLYSNRAMAKLKNKEFRAAELDCDQAIELDSTQIKAWFRRGLARKSLKKYNKSLNDFDNALRLDPKNKAAKKEKIQMKSKLDAMLKKSKQRSVTAKESKMRRIVIEECDDSDSDSSDESNVKNVERKESGNVEEIVREKVRMKEEVKQDIGGEETKEDDTFEMHRLPQNFIEFEKLWSRAKANKHKAIILMGLKKKRMDKIIKNMIDDTLFAQMIQTVHYIAMNMELKDALLILKQLTTLDRFEMIVMFLDESDQRLLTEMKDKCNTNKVD